MHCGIDLGRGVSIFKSMQKWHKVHSPFSHFAEQHLGWSVGTMRNKSLPPNVGLPIVEKAGFWAAVYNGRSSNEGVTSSYTDTRLQHSNIGISSIILYVFTQNCKNLESWQDVSIRISSCGRKPSKPPNSCQKQVMANWVSGDKLEGSFPLLLRKATLLQPHDILLRPTDWENKPPGKFLRYIIYSILALNGCFAWFGE